MNGRACECSSDDDQLNQQCRDLVRKDHHRAAYYAGNRYFRRELRKAKRLSWRKFVEEQDSVNKWGLHAKVEMGKIKPRHALESFGCHGLQAAGQALLESGLWWTTRRQTNQLILP